jgi:MFS family permease
MSVTSRPARSAAAYYNVRLFVAGQALSNIGTFSQLVALSLLVLQLSDSGFALGATMSVQAAPMLLLGPWAGVVLDRASLRRLQLITAVLGALQAFGLAFLALTGLVSLPWILLLALGLGAVQAFDRPAAQAFLVELVPPSSLNSAVALASTTQSIGRLGGPALAALLYVWQGPGTVFAVNGLSYLAVLAALLLLRPRELLPRVPQPPHPGQFKAALNMAWHSPVLRPALLANAFVGLFAFNFPTFFSTIATLTFGQPELFGWAESINAVAALAAGLFMSRSVSSPSGRLVSLTCLGLGSALLWVAVSPTPLVFLASMPWFGFVVVAYSVSMQALVQHHSPRDMAGRLMSLYALGTLGTTPLGGLLVGVMIDQISPRAAVGVGGASAVLAGVFLLRALREEHSGAELRRQVDKVVSEVVEG